MGSKSTLIKEFKSSMMSKFELTYLSLLHYFLRLEILQDEVEVFIRQKKYAVNLLKKFNISNCNVVATPMNMNQILQ